MKIKFKGEFQLTLKDVNSMDAKIIPQKFPTMFSAVFWIIPRKISSSINPVDNIITELASMMFVMLKLVIMASGCNIKYSTSPKLIPLRPTNNWYNGFPVVIPTSLTFICRFFIKISMATATGMDIITNQ